MKIVVLDGHTLNPGDLSWDGLRAVGDCAVWDRTVASDVPERAAGAEVVLTNKTRLDGPTIAALPALRYIGVLATGYDVVDVRAARARGVVVTHVPSYGTESVAQATFALLLELTNHVGRHAAAAREGRWRASGDFALVERPLVELHGLVLGVVGLGRIGRAVCRIASGFGMRVIAFSPGPPAPEGPPVERVALDALFRRADIVSLHCPLTSATARLVDAARLGQMKPGALLINTARGGLIDEAAVAAALAEGRLGGVGLDVLSVEPPPDDHPLLHAPRCVVTPHNAWATRASRERLLETAIANVRAFLAGRPEHVIDPA
jgi:glycerate dehydrogenase